ALDLGGQAISIGSQNEVLEGYPIPVFVGAKIMNPDEYANPIIEQDQVLGQVYPDRTIGIGTNLMLGRAFTIEALGEFVRGGHNMFPQGEINSRRRTFPPCFAIQNKFDAYNAGDASALDDVTATWR